MTTTNPRDEELREKLKVIYRKNQDDGGTFYHEAATDDIMQLIQEHDATRESGALIIGGKSVEFSHTAVNSDMHLFIDGYHNPTICPECIQPGLLVTNPKQQTGEK